MKARISGTSAGVAGRMLSIGTDWPQTSLKDSGYSFLATSVLLAVRLRVSRCSMRVGREPLVQRDREGEEFLLAVEGADHLDVEFGAFQRWIVEAADVVKEVSG